VIRINLAPVETRRRRGPSFSGFTMPTLPVGLGLLFAVVYVVAVLAVGYSWWSLVSEKSRLIAENDRTAKEIDTFMKANLKRDGDAAHWYYPMLMKGEWPVLLDILGKGEGDARYLSVAEVRTLFVERRLPDARDAFLRASTSTVDARAALQSLAIVLRPSSRTTNPTGRRSSGPSTPTAP